MRIAATHTDHFVGSLGLVAAFEAAAIVSRSVSAEWVAWE